MIYRKVRKSNDSLYWVNAVFCLAAAAGCVWLLAKAWGSHSTGVIALAVALVLFFILGFFTTVRGIVNPFENELVVETDVIRWGKSANPEKQRRLNISQIKGLVYTTSDGTSLWADIGKVSLTPVGHEILSGKSDYDSLVEALQNSFPTLKVETN